MPKPSPAIWTPNGIVNLDGKPSTTRQRMELKPGIIEWARQFADVAKYLEWGIHCPKCGADIIGKNADTDRVFSVACGCREWVGANRDYREPTAAEAFYEAVQDYDPTKVS